jgi:hypothetical protein
MPLPPEVVTGLEHGRIETCLDRVPRSDHASWPRTDDRRARTPLLHVASVPARIPCRHSSRWACSCFPWQSCDVVMRRGFACNYGGVLTRSAQR